MSAMEKMLAGMIGLTPDEMQSYVQNAMGMLQSIEQRFDRIEKALGIAPVYGNPDAYVDDSVKEIDHFNIPEIPARLDDILNALKEDKNNECQNRADAD